MATTRIPLTERQRQVYISIVEFWGKHGVSPTIRDLMKRFRFASTNGVVAHLKPLVRKGWIVMASTNKDDATARAIVVPEIHFAIQATAAQMVTELAGKKHK